MRVLLAVLVAVVVLSSVEAQIGGGHSLIISDLKTTPEEIHPGENFTLSFRVISAWGWERLIEDAYVHLEGGYPFLTISPTKPQRLRGLGYDIDWWVSRGALVSYNLSVDPNAVAGIYTLKAVFSYTRYSDAVGTRGGDERFTEVYPITIKVVGTPKLEVFVKRSEPEKPTPGDTIHLSLRVANLGSEYARNVLLRTGSVEGLAPEWSSRVVYLGDIAPRGSAAAYVTLESSPDLRGGEYLLPVTLLYRDGSRWVERNTSVKVALESPQSVDVYVDTSKPEKPKPGDTIYLRLKVVNHGTLPVKEAVLELDGADGVAPLWSSRKVFIGDIPAKGSMPLQVELEAEDDARTGDHLLPLRILSRGRVVAEDNLVVTLYSEADFDVKPEENSVRAGGSEQVVKFVVRNTGTEAAEQIRLTLRANYPFTPVGNEYYIERLSPGESVVAVFHVDVDSDAAEQRYPVDIAIKWTEDDEEHVKVKHSYVEVRRGGSKVLYYAAGILLLLIAAAVFIKKRKGR